MVSYLKSMYGDAATPENDFGYDWHPKIAGDYSHMATMIAMAKGEVKGALIFGQNPATSINGALQRRALMQLDWLVVQRQLRDRDSRLLVCLSRGEERPD
jgi:formate dehydrogenase major subunit